MNETNGKKQAAALWILGILVVILIAIIAGLFIMQAQTKNQEIVAKDAKIAKMEQEIIQLKKQFQEEKNNIPNTIQDIEEQGKDNEIATENNHALANEIAQKDEKIKELEKMIKELKKPEEGKESTIKHNTEDLNEEKEQIIRKLLLEKMPLFSFKESVSKDKYKVIGKYIDKIDIFSEAYYATEEYDSEKIQERVEWYKNQMNNTTFGTVEAIGTVSFTTKFDKTIDSNDMIIAGSHGSMEPYKNYVVQNFLFTLWKQNNGEYKLELGTGW